MAEGPGLESLFDLKSPLFSRDFVVVDLLPSITLVVGVTAVLLSGAPGSSPNGADFTDGLSQVDGTSFFLTLLVSIAIGVALHPFGVRLRRVLSGQWTHPATKLVAAIGYWFSKRRFKKVNRRIDAKVTASLSERARWGEIFRRELPEPPFLTPTRLGNAYQALRKCVPDGESDDSPFGPTEAEIYRTAYHDARDQGLAIVSLIDDARLKIAAAERYIVVWLLMSAALALLLNDHGWWLLLSGFALVLARVAYLGAVQAVVDYNYVVDDLFHGLKAGSAESTDSAEAAPRESSG